MGILGSNSSMPARVECPSFPFAVFHPSVFETACEVCLAVGDLGEYLKAQQALLTRLYPGAGPDDDACARWPELAGASVLFFLASARGRPGCEAEVARAMRAVPAHLRALPAVAFARKAACALLLNDWVSFFRLERMSPGPPPLLALLLAAAAPEARRRCLGAIASAFRTYPAGPLLAMLSLGEGHAMELEELTSCLASAGEPASKAASLLAAEGGASSKGAELQLVFRS